jgi:hypothetical protein
LVSIAASTGDRGLGQATLGRQVLPRKRTAAGLSARGPELLGFTPGSSDMPKLAFGFTGTKGSTVQRRRPPLCEIERLVCRDARLLPCARIRCPNRRPLYRFCA